MHNKEEVNKASLNYFNGDELAANVEQEADIAFKI